MPHWIRFERDGAVGFGTLEGDAIAIFEGNMFDRPTATGRTWPLGSVRLLAPTRPTKMIALWNNFRALGAKLGVAAPEDPLYLLKATSCVTDPDATVRRPASYGGKVVYEGELGIVIGRVCKDATEAEAESCIFGYTCVNDITAADILNKDPNFPQWVRAKSFDGFGPFGPLIATDVRPEELWVRTILNGDERQRYPISDMIFPPVSLVSRISQDMTLLPGDVICCGTSLGVGTMKEPTNMVEIEIAGIGRLRNTFVNG
jgi:2-keto-4-pentenoate hydratase/2-oxohepta-3-ene-1,7-dioic acid hydratase in catechol pathway